MIDVYAIWNDDCVRRRVSSREPYAASMLGGRKKLVTEGGRQAAPPDSLNRPRSTNDSRQEHG